MHITIRREAAITVGRADPVKVTPIRFVGDAEARLVRSSGPDLGPGGPVHQDVVHPPTQRPDQEVGHRIGVETEAQLNGDTFVRGQVDLLILHTGICRRHLRSIQQNSQRNPRRAVVPRKLDVTGVLRIVVKATPKVEAC